MSRKAEGAPLGPSELDKLVNGALAEAGAEVGGFKSVQLLDPAPAPAEEEHAVPAPYELWDHRAGVKRKLIARRDHIRGAARLAARLVEGEELFEEHWIDQVLLTGPGVEDRLYDYRFRHDTYKYRVRCPGPAPEAGQPASPCRNVGNPWMHPTTPGKNSQRCALCWSPTSAMRENLAARNRRLNAVLRPRAKVSKELFG